MSLESLITEVPALPRDEETTSWLRATSNGTGTGGVDPQRGQALRQILEDLGVPHADIEAGLRLDAGLERYPQLTALRRRAGEALLQDLGQPAPEHPLPTFAGTEEPLLRYFWMFVFADLVPQVTAWHAARGISAEVSRRTLADLGRHMSHNHRRLGYGGMTLNVDWLCTHFQGQLYQLGRLQFELTSLDRPTAAEIAASGRAAAAGDPCLAVHIPDYCGPFTQAECRASFARAHDFFAEHFPDVATDVFTCHSWLLDRRLPHYLPPTSNIVQFQELFTLAHREQTVDDANFFASVFGVPEVSDLDALPQTTSLQRALVQNLRDGHHWYGGVGWRPLAP